MEEQKLRRSVLFCLVVLAAGSSQLALAQTLELSTDVSVDLSGTVLHDEDVGIDDGVAAVVTESLGALPASADVAAFHALTNGDKLMSFDVTVEFPSGVRAEPEDVVLWDGINYSIVFDGTASGVPLGVRVDAVTEIAGALIVSFDTSVEYAGTFIDDEDLVEAASGALAFDGSAAGIDSSLDLDGASVLPNGNLALSFDGTGNVGGFFFDDEDVLEYASGSGSWTLMYDGSVEHSGFKGTDVDAVYAVSEPGAPVSLVAGFAFLWAARRSRSRNSNRRRTSQ